MFVARLIHLSAKKPNSESELHLTDLRSHKMPSNLDQLRKYAMELCHNLTNAESAIQPWVSERDKQSQEGEGTEIHRRFNHALEQASSVRENLNHIWQGVEKQQQRRYRYDDEGVPRQTPGFLGKRRPRGFIDVVERGELKLFESCTKDVLGYFDSFIEDMLYLADHSEIDHERDLLKREDKAKTQHIMFMSKAEKMRELASHMVKIGQSMIDGESWRLNTGLDFDDPQALIRRRVRPA